MEISKLPNGNTSFYSYYVNYKKAQMHAIAEARLPMTRGAYTDCRDLLHVMQGLHGNCVVILESMYGKDAIAELNKEMTSCGMNTRWSESDYQWFCAVMVVLRHTIRRIESKADEIDNAQRLAENVAAELDDISQAYYGS